MIYVKYCRRLLRMALELAKLYFNFGLAFQKKELNRLGLGTWRQCGCKWATKAHINWRPVNCGCWWAT